MSKLAIIGAGLIGAKRASVSKDDLGAFFDPDKNVANKFSNSFDLPAASSIDEIIANDAISHVIVCTPHKHLFHISKKFIETGRKVLIEKPGCMNYEEVLALKSLNNSSCISIGFNHRFHPSFLRIMNNLRLFDHGELMHIRASYGHGGRVGYENEWRAKKEISGGGELIDQGSHLIDLCLMFDKTLEYAYSNLSTSFWNMSVEDNAFVALKSPHSFAWIHASWTEWKNKFSFEVFFKNIKYDISGLGGSYGKEVLTQYTMSEKMGIPKIDTYQFSDTDNSWHIETNLFLENIEPNEYPSSCNIDELLSIWDIINNAYHHLNL
jgi:predicted dehydrogenase